MISFTMGSVYLASSKKVGSKKKNKTDTAYQLAAQFLDSFI